MKRIFRPEDLAPKYPECGERRRHSRASRDLAEYIAEMLHSLGRCSNAPDLRALQILLEAAEREARTISCDEPGARNVVTLAPAKGDMRPWRRGLS